MESMNRSERPEVTQDDIEAALKLIDERPELKENARVQALIARDFVTEDGRQLDPGDFLNSMLQSLEVIDNEPEPLSATERMKRIEEAMVVHSRPTLI
jgi:hypothetical protein